jgi:xanthine dehydrogenase large subunit
MVEQMGHPGEAPEHLSGPLLVTGRARFVSDEPEPAGMLHAKVVTSPHSHARIVSIDATSARAQPGVVAVLTAKDIRGENQIGGMIQDEPLLAADEACYAGQPVALVVAESAETAGRAVGRVRVEYEELEPVFDTAEALARGMLYAPERKIERGDVAAGLGRADFVLEGVIETAAQEHSYMETQRCRALPGEDNEITLHSSTQSPSEIQEIAARVLGCASKDVTVDVRRIGGGFGGKENAATSWACLAALGCRHTKRPVEVRLSRQEDMARTGKRHPFECRYRAGFARDGRITAYTVEFNLNGGAFADLSMAILERAMLHADNAYYIPNVRIIGRACRTNLPSNTAMRGFGAPQAIFAIESVMELAADRLGMDRVRLRQLNAYRAGQTAPYGQAVTEPTTPELLERLSAGANDERLAAEVAGFNRAHRFEKQGIGVVPVKFGISFTTSFRNQGSALVWVYADGSISASHGGVEMGQEVNTKIAQIVAAEFGVGLDRVRIETNNTRRIGNSSPTAASTGVDINGSAALLACRQITARLREFAAGLLAVDQARVRFAHDTVFNELNPAKAIPFAQLAHEANRARVNLGAHGFYRTPDVEFDRAAGQGRPFAYYVYGCCRCVAEVDLLTGRSRVLRADIVHEAGRSINPAVDRGQIAGAFLQGMGWMMMEELVQDKGRYVTDSLSTYKIPAIGDLPVEFHIELLERDRQHASVLGSKAIGEPPFIYGLAAFFATRDAIAAAAGHMVESELRQPATPEAVLAAVARTKG